MPNPTKTNSEQGRLNKGGDTSERIKTLAWWVKHADTEAEGIKIVEDFLAQQQSELLERMKDLLKTDYPTAWRVLQTRPDKHHEKCSWSTNRLLCDCAGMDVFIETMKYIYLSLDSLIDNK